MLSRLPGYVILVQPSTLAISKIATTSIKPTVSFIPTHTKGPYYMYGTEQYYITHNCATRQKVMNWELSLIHI